MSIARHARPRMGNSGHVFGRYWPKPITNQRFGPTSVHPYCSAQEHSALRVTKLAARKPYRTRAGSPRFSTDIRPCRRNLPTVPTSGTFPLLLASSQDPQCSKLLAGKAFAVDVGKPLGFQTGRRGHLQTSSPKTRLHSSFNSISWVYI